MAGAGPTAPNGDGPAWDRDGYRGTLAPNVTVPGLSRQLVITAVDLWTHAVQLRGTAEVDRATPFWFPSPWGITTDLDTTHTFEGGGTGSLAWEYRFVPSLPAGAQELRIFIGPEQTRPTAGDDLPAEPVVTIALPTGPVTARSAAAVVDPEAEPPPQGIRGDVERAPVRPTRVIPVSTPLVGAGERDLYLLNIDLRPEWFAVHIGGGGPLAPWADADGPAPRLLRYGWSAVDDRGGRYGGSGRGTHSGYPWTATATLAPALDPEVRGLTLTFPYPFGSGTVTATVDLQ